MKTKILTTTIDLIYTSGFIFLLTFTINAIINK